MTVNIIDVQVKETQENVYLATISITAPALEEFIVECKYKPADVNIPLDVPYFSISDSSKTLIHSKGFKVRAIMPVLKPVVINFAESI